jgi:hypothetical protein
MRCLKASKLDRCFTCRATIPKQSIKVSEPLLRILKALNWAYDAKPPVVNRVKTEEFDEEDTNIYVKKELNETKSYRKLQQNSDNKARPRKRARVYIENLGNRQ